LNNLSVIIVSGSISIENGGSIQLTSSGRAQPVNHFVDSQFPSLSQTLSSPIGISSAGQRSIAAKASNGTSNQPEIGHSLGQMNFGFQGAVPVPAGFHPHSLPDYPQNNGVAANGFPYNINSISAMGININPRAGEGIDGRHLQKMGSNAINGHSFDRNESGGCNK
jgi:hypothetical protein